MSDITITALIIGAAVVLFVWNRLPVVVVAMAVGLSLWATGLLTLNQALAGYGDPATIFIAALFVVSAALEQTGVTVWVGQKLIVWSGSESRARLLVLMGCLVAVLTILVTLNGAVAALLPVVVVLAVRLKRPPSQLLMPLVFSGHAGSLLGLTGTPVNVLVAEASELSGHGGFGFFEFALAGVPALAGVLAIIVLFGERLLPNRSGAAMPRDFSTHARTLVEQYGLVGGLARLRVREGSPLVGSSPAAAVDAGSGVQFGGALDGKGGALSGGRPLAVGDVLLVRGEPDAVAAFAADRGLAIREDAEPIEAGLFNSQSGLAEVMIPPRSALIGRTAFPGMVAVGGDLMVLGIQRGGADMAPGTVTLEAGDTILLQGTWKALDDNLADPDVLVVNTPEVVRRQAVPLSAGARFTTVVLVVMVALLATGVVPPAVASLLAAGALVLGGILTVEHCYRSISWTTVILIGALMPLSTVMDQTGAAKLMAEWLVAAVGDSSPVALLAGLFLLTAVMGQLISNTATALIVIPIGVAAAESLGISPQPVLMSITVAAAASFLTPIATPTNLMVMGPGGYAFGDYWKLGLPMMLWFFVVAVLWVPLVWSF